MQAPPREWAPGAAPARPRERVRAWPAARRSRESIYRRLLMGADAAAMTLTMLLCVALLGDDGLRRPFVLLPCAVVLVAKAVGLYDRDELVLRRSTLDELPRLFQLATLVTLVLWLGEGAFLDGTLGRSQVLATWALLLGLMAVGRLGARAAAGHLAPAERCLVIGDAEVSERLRAKLGQDSRVLLLGHVALQEVAHDLDALRAVAAVRGAERLVIAPGVGFHEEVLNLIRGAKATGLRVSIVPGVLDVVGSAVVFDDINGLTLLGVRRFGLTRSSRLLKRAMDIGGSLVGLVLLGPLMAAVAVVVRMESPGPALYRQVRVGRDGRRFTIFKFRTMIDGADELQAGLAMRNEAGEGLFKIAADPRVTRVGGLLRRASLDELPQLLNVLAGEMSLVGPRPLVVDEDERVTGYDRRRLTLTPGMTGQWQIAGPTREPLAEMLKIDYLYVAGWSVWSDAKVLLRTAAYVLGRRGQ